MEQCTFMIRLEGCLVCFRTEVSLIFPITLANREIEEKVKRLEEERTSKLTKQRPLKMYSSIKTVRALAKLSTPTFSEPGFYQRI